MGDPTDIGPPEPTLSKPVGERRQVTALFYDIVNSTALLNVLDPEDFGIAQRMIHATAAAVIRHNGGHLDQITGDGGCALFGYPVAAEDAAECAVGAALDIIERCKRVEQKTGGGAPIRIRVGVATGTVVFKDGCIAGLPGNRDMVGLAINLAARLQSIAAPDTALVSDTTHALTHAAFDYHLIGVLVVKGFNEPQRVWQPVARRDAELRFETLRRKDTPLVARIQELELGRNLWADAQKGDGRVLFLTGEAGIGKSRLVSELLHRTDAASCDRRIFQCQPRGNRRPFHAIVDRLLREVRQFRGQLDVSSAAIRDYIASTASRARRESMDILSFLAEAKPDETDAHQDPIDVPNQDFGQVAVDAMMDILSAWTRSKPQLLVLEDFQWADALTRSLIARIAAGIGHMQALLVVTSRDRADSMLAANPSVIVRDLSRLSAGEVTQLVEAIWQPIPAPGDLPRFVEEKSEGVPLFVEELTHLVRERFGTMRSGRPEWEQLLRREGVVTLKDLLVARIAGLGEARRVAQFASAIGRDFSYDLLAGIADEIERPALDGHLAALVACDIVHAVSKEGTGSFRFRHTLFQEAAYDTLLRSERHDLHNRIVAAAASDQLPKLSDDIMAWHCEQAGQFEDAAHYAIKAAETCAIRSAVHEAYHLLTSAEACLSRLEPGSGLDNLTLRLLATRGPVEMALFGSGSREACRTYDMAVAICRQKDPADRERWFPLYWGWWMTSPNAEAVARSRVIVSDLEKTEDAEIRLQALHCSWATYFHAGNHRECLRCINRGLELYDAERAITYRTKYGGHDAKVCALVERGQSLWFTGDLTSATNSVNAALTFAEQIDHLGSICHALDGALLLNHFEKNIPEVLRFSARMRELADRHTLPNCDAKSDIFAGWAWVLSGEVVEGTVMFERGLGRQRDIGTEEDLPLYLDMRSATLERMGQNELALEAIEEALDHALRTSDAFWLPELYRHRAMLAQRCGWPREVVLRDLEHALSLAEIQGAVTLARRVDADLKGFYARRHAYRGQ